MAPVLEVAPVQTDIKKVWATACSVQALENFGCCYLFDEEEGFTAVDAGRNWLERQCQSSEAVADVMPQVVARAKYFSQEWLRALRVQAAMLRKVEMSNTFVYKAPRENPSKFEGKSKQNLLFRARTACRARDN